MMTQFKIVSAFICLLIPLIVAGIATMVASTHYKEYKEDDKKAIVFKVLTMLGAVITVLCMLLTIIGLDVILVASNHGMYTNDITIEQLLQGVSHSPVEDDLPDDLSGSIILFYRFGCKDCEAVYEELAAYVAEKPNVYWVSSRSKQGEALRKTYPIESVPTGIYIHADDTDTYTKKTLDNTDENGNVVLDVDAINRLLYLQSENR